MRKTFTVCKFVSLFSCVFCGRTTLKNLRGPFLKDLELTRIWDADKAAVSVAIKRHSARRGYKSIAAFAGGWDASLRGQTGFWPRLGGYAA